MNRGFGEISETPEANAVAEGRVGRAEHAHQLLVRLLVVPSAEGRETAYQLPDRKHEPSADRRCSSLNLGDKHFRFLCLTAQSKQHPFDDLGTRRPKRVIGLCGKAAGLVDCG